MYGLLLINLGTPDEPTPAAVRRYLREFLSDPRVIDINPAARAALLNLVILPRRPAQSAAAYRSIWTERGSPLLFHTEDLAEEVRARLGEPWRVEIGMRYGQPSIAGALATLAEAGCERIVVFPLYPQYASSSTGTALEVAYSVAATFWNVPNLIAVPPFYDHPGYIQAFAERGRATIQEHDPEHILFSFHGLPERHLKKSDEAKSRCLVRNDCCDAITSENAWCYRAQCFATARALAAELALPEDGWSVSFQSRLGRTPWIRPFTDEEIPKLARRGIKRLAVFSPAFVADCLETLEEIGIRAVEQFKEHGGEDLVLVPSLNSMPIWADAVAEMATAALRDVASSAARSSA
jgi:protoporphyrin/coproporphyrin ferrochelatase